MCKLVEEIVEERVDELILNSLCNLMKNLHLTLEQAMDALEIPMQDRNYYRSEIQDI